MDQIDQQTLPPGPAAPAAGSATRPAAGPSAHDDAFLAMDRLLHAAQGRATLGISPVGPALAFMDWAAHLANAPFRRMALRQEALEQWRRLFAMAVDPQHRPAILPAPGDHRFADPAWHTPPYNLIHQSFLLAEEWLADVARGSGGVNVASERIVAFAMRQWLDVFSPSNVPWLNPEVIAATRATGGRNLVAGMHNLLTDLQRIVEGEPNADAGLQIGRDLAATPGKIVLRNGLMELIQYTPSTPTTRPEPVLIVPAWIMKYYILDLSAQNSLIRHLVAQGHTVFAISWRNPGDDARDTTLEDYRTHGVMAALDAVQAICGTAGVHGCGYCLGGTLLAVAAAAMARDSDARLASLTLLAAQTDFTEAGELQLFINEDELAFLDDTMETHGYLDSRQMAGAFQMLRSNDLIWSRAVRSYLLGEPPTASDLMQWNADGTRMPARMHAEYLRRMFMDNDLAEGRFPAGGRPVALGDIKVPLFVVATETDHIAPWRSVYKIHLLNSGDLTFVLTSGGHNAGIVSEPGHPHRRFRIREREAGAHYEDPKTWLGLADQHDGSWWTAWFAWLDRHSGKAASPPPLGAAKYPPLDDAPGRYVMER